MSKPFTDYATAYNCTLAQAISDRDFPATEKELTELFLEESGRLPTPEEMQVMHPETSQYVQSWLKEQEV